MAITAEREIGCPEFISTIFCLSDVLSVTLPISKNLQNEGIEYTEAASVITDAISVLQERHTDCQHFVDVFEAASKPMQVLNVSGGPYLCIYGLTNIGISRGC